MICPVCGRKFSFFRKGVYCSSECAEKAVRELDSLLKHMEQEEDEINSENESQQINKD